MLSARLSANSPKGTQFRLFRLSSDRRTPPRVTIAVGGRFMLEDRTEHGGTAVDASVRAISIRTDAVARVGERVVGYFDAIGRIEGKVEPLNPDGFQLELTTTLRKRGKLAARLIWLANRDVLNLPEDRWHDRVVPLDPRVTVKNLSDVGHAPMAGHLIDLSQGGAGVSVTGRFQKGDDLLLGTTPARVVRVFDGGVAVEFRAPIPDVMFSPEIRL
jgi:hypothetical protein